jgi:quinolinate synthase
MPGERKAFGKILSRIVERKKETDALILAHNYQPAEIQEIADLIGDSLELARAAASEKNKVLIFCGVDFMAETAAVLSPDKRVILPVPDACCPMADMITPFEVRQIKERFPSVPVVAYVNTSAAVKAESDICCTSANAVKVVASLPDERVIFLPDQNLARYVARFATKEVIPFEGYCIVHDRYRATDVDLARMLHAGAEVLVHPECRPEVIDTADYVASTSGMIRHVKESSSPEFIIGTETGILYRLARECPGKACYPLRDDAICVNMKKTTLAAVADALDNLEPVVTVDPAVASGARRAVARMLNIS